MHKTSQQRANKQADKVANRSHRQRCCVRARRLFCVHFSQTLSVALILRALSLLLPPPSPLRLLTNSLRALCATRARLQCARLDGRTLGSRTMSIIQVHEPVRSARVKLYDA